MQTQESPRIWAVLVNGIPLESKEDLKSKAESFCSDGCAIDELVDCLWTALQYDNPEIRIEEWIDREPVFMAQIDFASFAEQSGVSIPEIAASTTPISELIIKSTAGVLLRGGLSNHFAYLESGELVVNPDNPPTLDQGYEIVRRTMEIKETGQKLDNYSSWTLGMLGDQLERFFGDNFDVTSAVQTTGKVYNTYVTSVGVFRAYWANKRNLSFTHHKEVFYSKISSEAKDAVLDVSEKLGLTVQQQRKLLSHVRIYGHEAIEEELETAEEAEEEVNTEEFIERIDVRSTSKNFVFFLRSENKWFHFRGPFQHIPNGADPIINADSKKKMAMDGTEVALDHWTPVGTPASGPVELTQVATQIVEEEDAVEELDD